MAVPPSGPQSTQTHSPPPLIPEKYLDVPSQRLYYLSLGVIIQAIKLFDFIALIASSEGRSSIFRKWLLVDFLYCIILMKLRIPRLRYSTAAVILQVLLLWIFDAVVFGGIVLNAAAFFGGSAYATKNTELPAPSSPGFVWKVLGPLSFGLISSSSLPRDAHLLGQHTVRMSPISTAHLNPQSQTFCLSSPSDSAIIPIVLNNTDIAGLRYTVTPLGGRGRTESFEVSSRDLKMYEQAYNEKVQVGQQTPLSSANKDEDEYEYDDDEDDETRNPHSDLQKTQSLAHLLVQRPGIVRLERVYDVANNNARLAISEAVIVPCPRVEFGDDGITAQQSVRCEGDDTDLQLKINVFGVPPLSLKWLKTVNGEREQFLVDGIENETIHTDSEIPAHTIPEAQKLNIPLTVSLQRPGSYVYALEEITDAIGNTVQVSAETWPASQDFTKTKNARSFMVLRRPAISFSRCSVDMPISLLIGSDAWLRLKSVASDPLDGPWDVALSYQPPVDADGKVSKVHKAWKKNLKVTGDPKDLEVHTSAPGDYQITNIKGKHCSGIVLVPDTCRVVEKPLPSAEIEWKRIHECSGDTGVSASLILRGAPPFQIYYRVQRDNEPAREFSKTFATSRADFTIQPESSGHYTFTFVSISDANYRKIELQGPSIEQVIHPVASADFAEAHGSGSNKRMVSTCSGDTIDVDVNLRGTAPWTLNLKVIGPQTLESIKVENINSPRQRITVPIPKELRKSGGNFEIDLINVEDASKCKRDVTTSGIVVKVRRVIPTVQFYGKQKDRHVLVTENQGAKLPLRLTGDGPWRVKYRRQQNPDRLYSATLHNPNDALQVSEQGTFEIVSVVDSQCPGSIVTDASTYEVQWIPRPSAKVAPTSAASEAYNGSYILPPICQDASGHVDLELTGRPPFQVSYNIAQSNELGGTRLLEQLTHNSIQPRTRFALRTDTPGRIYYEVKQIGDAAYPLSSAKDTTLPRSRRLLFEQQVSVKPSARFRSTNKLVYCLNDVFSPTDSSSPDGYIHFEGIPPFTLGVSIRNLASSHVDWQQVEVPTNVWKLDLPNYSFSSTGPHRMTLETLKDSSNCEKVKLDQTQSIRVEVAETAAIIPFDRRQDFCVGETIQFQLEGIPPWTIGYKINNKQYTPEVKVPPFAISPQQPGLVTITSIAHQHKMCKVGVSDLQYRVHALPSAQVGHGKRIFQDIHEGDQAEIVFSLIGEPPFTFTYQRSELASKKGGVPKVLETHTASRIMTHEYSIFSALEGTWTITSISDKHCRYPPVQPDVAFDKS